MFRSKLFFVPFLAMLSACATVQPLTGDGKYLQYEVDGVVIFQVDFNTPEVCRRNGESERNTNAMLKMSCSTESLELSLPISFVATDTILGLKSTFHARTLEACRLAQDTVKANQKESRFELTECK